MTGAARLCYPLHIHMVRVFLFAGQSNMAGADAPFDPARPTCNLEDLGVQRHADRAALLTFAFGLDPNHACSVPWGPIRGHGGSVGGKTHDAAGQLHHVIGPETGFCRRFLELRCGKIAIIKGSANFQTLIEGRSPWVPPGPLWTQWENFVQLSLQRLRESRSEDCVIAGFVWFQGIDDGLLRRDFGAYRDDLAGIVEASRRTSGAGDQPFVIVQSLDSEVAGRNNMRPIRDAQAAVAKSLPGCILVSSADLPYTRGHHLTAASQLRIGRRIAEAMHRNISS